MKIGTESQIGGTMWKGRRWERICSLLQILARSIPKKGFSTPVANLLSYEKKLALELGLQKNDFDGTGLGVEGGCRRLSTFREERRHSKPRSQQCLAY